tara:strand:- start:38638 stop:38880 length:243 start_codon:yes stop_codon:yes gene_type:complete
MGPTAGWWIVRLTRYTNEIEEGGRLAVVEVKPSEWAEEGDSEFGKLYVWHVGSEVDGAIDDSGVEFLRCLDLEKLVEAEA